MEPTNLHELVIAQAVDKKFREGPTDRPSIIRDVALSLDFEVSTFLRIGVRFTINTDCAHPVNRGAPVREQTCGISHDLAAFQKG
jgi:hypothetical protein